jgi:hypothetical protein
MTGDKGSGILDLYRRETGKVKSKGIRYLDHDLYSTLRTIE